MSEQEAAERDERLRRERKIRDLIAVFVLWITEDLAVWRGSSRPRRSDNLSLLTVILPWICSSPRCHRATRRSVWARILLTIAIIIVVSGFFLMLTFPVTL